MRQGVRRHAGRQPGRVYLNFCGCRFVVSTIAVITPVLLILEWQYCKRPRRGGAMNRGLLAVIVNATMATKSVSSLVRAAFSI